MRINILTALVITVSTYGAIPKSVDLASMKGWDIVIAEDAIPSEIYAAKEFQNHFEFASGIKLPIVREVNRPDHHVFIGLGKVMQGSALGFDIAEFGDEDLRIVVRDNNIVIAGGRPRGTLYGVYTFLEDYLGIRFLTAEHTHIPRIGKWHQIGPSDRFFHPPFNFRWSAYAEVSRNPAFAARLRVNTVPRDPNLGGRTKINLVTHTFYRQVPVEKYGKEHPEYYSLVDGERKVLYGKDIAYNQLCLTNPDVLRIVTDAVLAELKANPDMANVAASQNDGVFYCQCPNCAVIDQREYSGAGSLVTFVNAIADKVAEEYPDVLVGTFAYNYTQNPPMMLKPRPNVQIQLCNRSCMLHPIDDTDCPANAKFCRILAGWGKICEHVYLWTYNTNTFNYLLPWPNLRVLESDIRYFAANNVKGVFMCAAGGMGSEFSELRNYMMAGLLWDPSRSGQQLMDEFLDLHYGRAAEPIRRFINLVHDYVPAKFSHLNKSYKKACEFGIDQSIALAGLDAFAEALKLAEDETTRMRVEKASICAYRAAVEPVLSYPFYWEEKDKAGLDPALVERVRPLAKRLFELCEKYGVDRAGMYTKIEDYRDRLKGLIDF